MGKRLILILIISLLVPAMGNTETWTEKGNKDLAEMQRLERQGERAIHHDKMVNKVKYPSSWLSRKATKYGFILTVMATNSLRMAKEADNFDSRDLLGKNTYHAVNAFEIIGWIASGYMLYAVIDRDEWSWMDKTRLIAGTALLTREAGEFTYQGMRHGNPFNNNPDWHQNEFTWFTNKNTFPFIQDRMISTGELSTPMLHIGMTGAGALLIGGVK